MEMRDSLRIEEELHVLYNSIQEGIEVAGKDGTIQYVNPYFSRLTGISPHERIGKNIFELSPEGALARVLRTHEPIYAHRSTIEECATNVIANAYPIIIEGNIEAGLVVFKPLTDASKLSDELEVYKQRIQVLSNRINQMAPSIYSFDDILGSHPDFVFVRNKARRAAETNTPVMIRGESGSGKELFAHAIHSGSLLSHNPFMKIDCADLPESLLESALLGYEKNSQGNSSDQKLGKLECASGGTLFLDEIGLLNEHMQNKLLNILQKKKFQPLNGLRTIELDVRIISATNRDLKHMVENGEFSEDLYHLLNGVDIPIPPLRKHKEDALTYAQNFIYKANRKLGKNVIGITTQAEQLLLDYHWPGNIRELKNVIEMAMDSVEGDMLNIKDFASLIEVVNKTEEIHFREPMALDQLEKKMIRLALERYGNSVEGKKRAAGVLKISLATLYNKLKTLEDNA
nr:sigma 54-interacting transcriptional regulator [Desulfitobacterium dichloroeliminans]